MDKWITMIYKAKTDGERFGVPVSDLGDGQLFARTSRKLTTHKSRIQSQHNICGRSFSFVVY